MFIIEAIKSSYFFQQIKIHFHLKLPHEKKYYYRHIVLDREKSNKLIVSLLKTKQPFFITRLGGIECEIIRQSLLIKHHLKKNYSKDIIESSKRNAGVFPNTANELMLFTEFYLKSIKKVNCFGIWYRPMEGYILKKNSEFDTFIDFYALYPGINTWTSSLKGNKVLIVHPFAKTIETQYNSNRTKIFPNNPDLLPTFKLITYKSVVSHAGEELKEYDTWRDALFKMYDDISKLDFDICLLGCGAYGLPLGSMIYNNMHKKVIHVGGSLQLLFGIDGNLYHNYDLTKHLMNEYWVYPSKEETPKNANGVEDSMYWKKD